MNQIQITYQVTELARLLVEQYCYSSKEEEEYFPPAMIPAFLDW